MAYPGLAHPMGYVYLCVCMWRWCRLLWTDQDGIWCE